MYFQGVMELTDGWYGIKAALDAPLTHLVQNNKLRIGDKLCIYGAELIGSQDAAPPLQVRVRLKEGVSS